MYYVINKIHHLLMRKRKFTNSVFESHEFCVGEIVVCIDDKKRKQSLGYLKKNELYTISDLNPVDGGVILQEIKCMSNKYQAYAADRFRKVDMSFVDEVLALIATQDTTLLCELNSVQYN